MKASNKKLSVKHKNPLKARKQELIDRINACRTISEIEGFERTLAYHPILKDDQDWDYDFFINLIEFKLKKMSQYFHTHHIVENEDWYGTLCDRAIDIIHAGYKSDIVLEQDLHVYVNSKNAYRFLNPKHLKFITESPRLKVYYLPTVREYKAKALFWKFMHHYIEYLWD